MFLDYPSHDQWSQKENKIFTCNSFQPSEINFILKDPHLFHIPFVHKTVHVPHVLFPSVKTNTPDRHTTGLAIKGAQGGHMTPPPGQSKSKEKKSLSFYIYLNYQPCPYPVKWNVRAHEFSLILYYPPPLCWIFLSTPEGINGVCTGVKKMKSVNATFIRKAP